MPVPLIIPPTNSGVWRDSRAYFIPSPHKDDIESVLRRRGQEIAGRGQLSHTLIPYPPSDHQLPRNAERFRLLFADATVRKLLRQLTSAKGARVPITEFEGTAGRRTAEIFAVLEECEVTYRSGDLVQLHRPVDNIGPTLECYVSDVCRRELAGSSE